MARLKAQFGTSLQQLRRRAGLSQEQLADATGLTVKSASNPECGAFGRRFANLEKIARVQKVPVKALFELGKE